MSEAPRNFRNLPDEAEHIAKQGGRRSLPEGNPQSEESLVVAFYYALTHEEERLVDELIRYAHNEVGLTVEELTKIYDAAFETKFREENE
jgi:hypothetical protein